MARARRLKRLFNSFAGRIILGGAVIHALLIPFLFSGLLFIVEQGYRAEFVNYVRSDAYQFAKHLGETAEIEHIRGHLDDAILSGRVVFAQLEMADGRVISAQRETQSDDLSFTEDFSFGEHGDAIYHIAMPIEFQQSESAMQGDLLLGYDESRTHQQIALAYRQGMLLAGAYIVLSLILVAIITPQFSRPLRQLRDAAQRIAAGHSAERLEVKSSIDELSDLAHELDSMRYELVRQSQAVTESEAHTRAIMDNVVDGIITINARGDIESLNLAAERMFGYQASEVIGQNLNVLLAQPYFCDFDHTETVTTNRAQAISSMATHETAGRRNNGETFPMEMAISEMAREEGPLFIAIARDITERKEAEAELKALQEDLERRVIKRTRELATLNRELEHQALHDALTELPNRVLLQDRLRQATLTAQREEHPLALLLMDLDRFKEINDTLGHHYGDLVLQQVASRMQASLRQSDTIARLGGDEFAVLLPLVDNRRDATHAAQKIVEAMERPITLEGQNFQVGASIGIALYPEHGTDSATLMRHADVAMYVAKRSNSGYAVYDPDQDEHSVSRLALVGELRWAIEHHQLALFYQPKVDLRRNEILGVEAVARWHHPQRGLLLPDEFIPLAEHTGLIRALTLQVLETALEQIQAWRHQGLELTMAVNLSARHLQDEELPNQIAELMTKWDIEPQWLELEITESAIMADPLRAMEILTRLDAMGVGLAIDDFGTGYSSLIYLKQLPVDEIKIDKSFVIDMLDNNEDLVIVRSTIDLAHNMGRRVVAEGVESREVLETLLRLGCDMAQGYYMSQPLSADLLQRWLQGSSWAAADPGDKG